MAEDFDEEEDDRAPSEGGNVAQALAMARAKGGGMQFLPGVSAPGAYQAPEAPPEIQFPTVGEEAEAGAAGLGRGASFGLSDVGLVRSKLVKPETLERLKRIAPGISTAGEFAGAGLAGAGLTALSGGALGPEVAASLAGRLGTQAAIGGAMGLGTALSEDALGEAPLAGEHVLGTLGLHVLFGAAGGAAGEGLLMGAGKLLPKAVDAFGGAVAKAQDAFGGLASEGGEPGTAELLSHAGEATSEEQLGLEKDWDVAAKEHVKVVRGEKSGAAAEQLQNVIDTSQEALNKTWGQHEALMAEQLKGADPAPALDEAGKFIADTRAQIEAMNADKLTHAAASAPVLIGRLGALTDRLGERLGGIAATAEGNPDAAAEAQRAMFEFRRDFDKGLPQKLMADMGRAEPLLRDTLDVMKQVRRGANDVAGSDAAFGDAGKAYTDFNRVFSQHENALENYDGNGVLDLLGGKDGQVDRYKLEKILLNQQRNTPLNPAGAAKAAETMAAVNKYLETARNLHEAITQRLGEPVAGDFDIPGAIDRLSAAQAEAKTAASAAVAGVNQAPGGKIAKGYAQTFAQMAKEQAAEKGGAELGLLGLGAHAMGLGPVVEGAAAVMAGGKMLKALPVKAIKVMGTLQRIAGAARAASRGIAEDAVNGESSSVAARGVAGRAAGGLKEISLGGEGAARGETLQDSAARVSGEVQKLAADPEGLTAKIGNAVAQISHHAPNIAANMSAAGVRGIQFLAMQAPKNPYQGVGFSSAATDKAWRPSPAQSSEFEQHVLGTMYPFRTLQRVTDGKATPNEVAALKAVWPELHKDTVQAMQVRFQKSPGKFEKLPYQKRIALSQFSGQPADPTMLPGNIAKMQQPNPMNMQPQQHRKMPVHGKFTLGQRSGIGPNRGTE